MFSSGKGRGKPDILGTPGGIGGGDDDDADVVCNMDNNMHTIYRVTVTLFCSISMPVDFCLVGKNSERCFVTVIALKYILLLCH